MTYEQSFIKDTSIKQGLTYFIICFDFENSYSLYLSIVLQTKTWFSPSFFKNEIFKNSLEYSPLPCRCANDCGNWAPGAQ